MFDVSTCTASMFVEYEPTPTVLEWTPNRVGITATVQVRSRRDNREHSCAPFPPRRACTASRTPSGTSSPKRRRWRPQARASATSTSAIRWPSGFNTPPHLIAAVERAMRDGHNNYGPSAGHRRRARSGGRRIHAQRISGHRRIASSSPRARPKASSCAQRDRRRRRRSARADADLSALHGGARQARTPRRKYYRLDPAQRMDAGSRSPAEPGHAGDARARRHRSQQSDRRGVSRPRRGARCSSSPTQHGLLILADEVYGDLGFDGPVAPLGLLDPDARDHLVLEPVESVSRARLAHRLDGHRPIAAPRRRGGGGEEAGGRPPVQHGADAVRDRRRRSTATGRISSAFREALKARADLTVSRLRAMPGVTCVDADRGVLRDAARGAAAGDAPTRTTSRRCCTRPACCASTDPASACRPKTGFLRIVFLAPLDELREIYDLMAAFTAGYFGCTLEALHVIVRPRVHAAACFRRFSPSRPSRCSCCALWAAREALMLIYVSALIAMGFSPLVRLDRTARGAEPPPRVSRAGSPSSPSTSSSSRCSCSSA